MKGSRCRFSVHSKSFEILVEIVKGKVLEEGQGLSSWIIFREKGRALLLEGVEECSDIPK